MSTKLIIAMLTFLLSLGFALPMMAQPDAATEAPGLNLPLNTLFATLGDDDEDEDEDENERDEGESCGSEDEDSDNEDEEDDDDAEDEDD